MDFNFSIYTSLTLESLELPPSNVFPAFIFGTLTYCAILVFNMTVLLTIALNRKLHKPMYVLLFNLPISDMVGASAFFPQLVSSILSQNRSITYSACFVQALLVHLCGTGAILTLSAMAYDRYIAICCPLKYNTLMSPNNLLKIIIMIWILDFTLIGSLLALNYRKEICSTKIVDIFCNNPSLMKLVCGDTKLNNYYGLFLTAFFEGLSLLIVVFTYIQILITVVVKRQSDAKSKAIQTCGTHLIVFLCFQFTAVFAFIAHRIDAASPSLRRAFGASAIIFPPIINPLIYGLKTKEVRQTFIFFFHKTFFPTKQNKLSGMKMAKDSEDFNVALRFDRESTGGIFVT
ncbi:putative gustatory receptor clone PTE01 [Pygocentrus nattereri]|uniref:putative gustatory receptor clone PTE01 n=1 Tax=Pygocentrus nattereri TaxID=42514 RepID=UPI0008148103|nr:putative gustatory receptor clone PTE01 [Pygocentrus nattereri]